MIFAGFLICLFSRASASSEEPQKADRAEIRGFVIWLKIIGGLTALIIGGRFIVTAATDMAEAAGLSEKFIGLTVVAAGTSLPELAASVTAALKNQKDLAVGNVIGSNIFNLLFILPVSAPVNPPASNPSFNADFLTLGGATIFLFTAMFTFRKGVLDRREAGMLLAGYVIYTVLQLV